jgi:hypothetical protein
MEKWRSKLPPKSSTPHIRFGKWGVFSEDRAWVSYRDAGITYDNKDHSSMTLIDNTGKVLFQTDYELLYCSPFEDGLSYCLADGKPDYTWFIKDKDP